MLDRTHRFHGNNSLNFGYAHGQTVRGQQLSLKYALNRRRNTYRVAVVVSRKVDKSAVGRNRLRRRVYEVVRAEAPAIREPYDLIFTVYQSDLSQLDQAALQRLVHSQLARAGVLAAPKSNGGVL